MGRKFGVAFSAKRAFGISGAKQWISRKTGIPLTRSGRQRKFGRAMGCCVFIAVVAAGLLLSALYPALESLGEGTNSGNYVRVLDLTGVWKGPSEDSGQFLGMDKGMIAATTGREQDGWIEIWAESATDPRSTGWLEPGTAEATNELPGQQGFIYLKSVIGISGWDFSTVSSGEVGCGGSWRFSDRSGDSNRFLWKRLGTVLTKSAASRNV